MTDYTITHDMFDLLQDVELMLSKACGSLQVLAERLEEGEGNRPEGPACWFILDGLRLECHRLAEVTEDIAAIHRRERLKIVDNGDSA